MSIETNKWVSNLPEINKKNSIKRYFLTIILFIIGLILVSAIKNETRNIQKEINYLQKSINILKFDLNQATLDHEVITSPENISRLAKEYLPYDLVPYNKSQIKQSNEKVKTSTKLEAAKRKKNFKKKSKELQSKIKLQVVEKTEEKRIELRKFREYYSKSEKLQSEKKLLVAKKIEKTKTDLQKLNASPKDSVDLERMQKWAGLQIIKAFLGIPIVPGR